MPISDGTPGTGGFLTFPGAQFSADPSSNVTVPKPGARGRSSFGLTYDHAFTKWLPVPRDWVSPDGARYAYPSPNSIVLVNVLSGTVAGEFGVGTHWQVVDLESGGIYAYQVQDATTDPPIPASGGLWVLPFAGAAHLVENTVTQYPIAVHGTIFYAIDYLSWIGSPYAGTNSSVFWRDLAGNGRGISFSELGSMGGGSDGRFKVVGVDANGNVWAWLSNNQLWYAKDNTAEHPEVIGSDTPRIGPYTYSVLTDVNGTWLAAQNGLYLLTATAGFQRAADHSGNLGGSCI